MLRKLLLREIKGSFGRFAAIFAIIALGVGFFSGLKVCKTAMLKTGDDYIGGHRLFDCRVLSTLGFTEEDVQAFAELGGVASAEGSVTADFVSVGNDGEESVLKAHSITENVNTLSLVAGRMPEAAGECVADAMRFSPEDIGETIAISSSNDADTKDIFACDEYIIVGLVNSVYYLNYERGTTTKGNGTVSGFLYIPRDGFSTDYYTEIFLSYKEGGFIYTDEYENAVEAMESPVKERAELLADDRYNGIMKDAQEALEDAQAEYDEGLTAYNDGVRQYKDGQAAYEESLEAFHSEKADAERQLQEAADQLRALENTLATGRASLAQSREEAAEGRSQVEAGYAQLEENRAEADVQLAALDAQKAELTQQLLSLQAQLSAIEGQGLTEQEAELRGAISQAEESLLALQSAEDEINRGLAQAQQELDTQLAAIEASEAQLAAAEQQLSSLEAQIQSGWTSYYASERAADQVFADAQSQLDEAKEELEATAAELQDAKADLDTGAQELENAKTDISNIEYPSVYELGRDTNVGYVCFESDSSMVEGIAAIFPLFFFLVAGLICVTTMNRMVDEQRTQIGVLKALGYSEKSIMYKYLMYSGLASVLGCAAGFYAGSWAFPKVIWKAFTMMYGFSDIEFVLDYRLGIVVTVAYLACILGVTFSTCKSELLAVPAELIRPKSPKSGKRVFLERLPFLWKNMSFLHKVSARNIFRYKKRLIMMVLGIGGCTALLVTGFGINDSISELVNYQFDEIMVYDCDVTLKENFSAGDREAIAASLGDEAEGILYLHVSTADAEANGASKAVHFMVCGDGEVSSFIDLHDGGEKLSVPRTDEALLSRALADELGLRAGDTITVRNSDMETLSLTVSGIFDNYVYHYIIVSDETCSEQWGAVPETNTAYVNIAGSADVHEAAAQLMSSSAVGSVTVTQDLRTRIGNMMDSMNYIVLMVIFCAGALAFIVIFNLTSINITERNREIATIKVLGFYAGETAAYVFRENTVMTVAGAAVGLGLGKLLHAYVMSQIRIDMISFDVRVTGLSYLYSVLFTFAFAALVNLAMYFRIGRINMAESLKSAE